MLYQHQNKELRERLNSPSPQQHIILFFARLNEPLNGNRKKTIITHRLHVSLARIITLGYRVFIKLVLFFFLCFFLWCYYKLLANSRDLGVLASTLWGRFTGAREMPNISGVSLSSGLLKYFHLNLNHCHLIISYIRGIWFAGSIFAGQWGGGGGLQSTNLQHTCL